MLSLLVQLGFDDPTLRIERKPVEAGTMVMYQITLAKLEKEGEIDILGLIYKWYAVVLLFGLIGGALYWNYRKQKLRGKKKKKTR